MQNKAVKNFLDGFSVEVTPRAAAKIDNFENCFGLLGGLFGIF